MQPTKSSIFILVCIGILLSGCSGPGTPEYWKKKYDKGDSVEKSLIVDKLLHKIENNTGTSSAHNAVEALGLIRDKKAVNTLLKYIDNEHHAFEVIKALGEIGDTSIIDNFIPYLRQWKFNTTIVTSLTKVGWYPKSTSDSIYYWVAKRDGNALKENWQSTQKVLLMDITNSDIKVIQNALFAFIGIGNKDIIPVLIFILNTKGNKVTAEAYLNCGNQELSTTAEEWAKIRGYKIVSTTQHTPVYWGAW